MKIVALVCLGTLVAHGSAIILNGTINQNAGGSAVNNPSLNNISDGDEFTVTMGFSGGISSPADISLTSLVFRDPSAPATESGFISGDVVITQASSFSQFSIEGCLISSAACTMGNQLAIEFQIPTANIGQGGIAPQPIPALLPFDLLEDGGSTDIQGTLSNYTYTVDFTPPPTIPEPSTGALLSIAVSILAFKKIGGK